MVGGVGAGSKQGSKRERCVGGQRGIDIVLILNRGACGCRRRRGVGRVINDVTREERGGMRVTSLDELHMEGLDDFV